MVIVYTYRDDGHDGRELRYSIRSMVKHFLPLTDILLMTTAQPSWYRGKFIPFTDIEGRQATSIIRKMLGAAVDNFLWCADDHFALKPFDECLPNYYNRQAHYVDYKLRKMIGNCSPHWLNYICHTPMIINREKLQAAFDWADGREIPVKTLYANFNSLPGTLLYDLKFRGDNSYENIKSQIAKRPFFSTHENAINGAMLRVFQELYPNKTEYEA